jgi:hypothetical protein
MSPPLLDALAREVVATLHVTCLLWIIHGYHLHVSQEEDEVESGTFRPEFGFSGGRIGKDPE